MEVGKSYINKKNIFSKYMEGMATLIDYIQNNECIVIEDRFSEEVVDIVLNDDGYIAREKIEQMLK
jgi:hypothetical protein